MGFTGRVTVGRGKWGGGIFSSKIFFYYRVPGSQTVPKIGRRAEIENDEEDEEDKEDKEEEEVNVLARRRYAYTKCGNIQ